MGIPLYGQNYRVLGEWTTDLALDDGHTSHRVHLSFHDRHFGCVLFEIMWFSNPTIGVHAIFGAFIAGLMYVLWRPDVPSLTPS